MNQTKPEKSISEQLSDIFSKLTKDQLRFVVAMQEFPTKKEAAESIGIEPDTVYRYPKEVDEACKLMALNVVESAKTLRVRALAKAVAVKLSGLDSDDEKVRQAAASEIIEWELGKAKMPVEHSGEIDGALKIIEVKKA